MKESKPTLKTAKPVLLWAIDPLEVEARPSRASLGALGRWARAVNWEIQPVCVVTPSLKDLERGLLGSVNHIQSSLDSYLKGYPKARKGRVIVSEHSGQAAAVGKLVRFARQEGAAAIAVSSHGRSGLDRFVLGSFAENLLETSPFPVFFLNQRSAEPKLRRNVVLFPTNFSEESHATYREFLRRATGSKLEVILFHEVSYPLQLDTGLGAFLPEGYLEDQEKWARSEGALWLAEARERQVKAEFLLRAGGIGFLNGESVLAVAKEQGASVIVMTSTGNAMGRLLIGSVAYPVFRSNQVLTLMYGPKARALSSRESEERPAARAER